LKIDVRMTRVGGGFGRRLSNDFIAEAVMLSKLVGKPIKLLWTREEDMRHDWYRPFGHHHLIATLDANRQLTGWAHRLASASKYYRRPDVKPEEHVDLPSSIRVTSLRSCSTTFEWNGLRSTPASRAARGARPRTLRTPSPCRVSSTKSHMHATGSPRPPPSLAWRTA
jgi:hypothetical protein